MYTYKSSLGLARSIGAQWTTYELENIVLRDIFAKYTQVYITVVDSFTAADMHVDLHALKATLAGSPLTVNEWLVTMDGLPLPTVVELPDAKLKFVKYSNAIMSGYKISLSKMGYNYPANYPTRDLTDLEITRPVFPTDISLLHTKCLMTVNGYFHNTDTDGSKAFIVDGGMTASKSRCSHVGIMSFLDIGNVKKVPLTPTSIIPMTEDSTLKEGIKFIIDEDLTDKSCFLVLGGYLVLPETQVFWNTSENSFGLALKNLPYVERYMESYKQIDLSSMDVVKNITAADSFELDSFWTDDVIRQYMTVSQSFLVIVDTKRLFLNKLHARVSNLPGFLSFYQNPVYPLFMGYGKAMEYTKIKEANGWALRITDPFYKQYALSTLSNAEQPVVTDRFLPYTPYVRTKGYLLEMAGYPTEDPITP